MQPVCFEWLHKNAPPHIFMRSGARELREKCLSTESPNRHFLCPLPFKGGVGVGLSTCLISDKFEPSFSGPPPTPPLQGRGVKNRHVACNPPISFAAFTPSRSSRETELCWAPCFTQTQSHPQLRRTHRKEVRCNILGNPCGPVRVRVHAAPA